MTRGVSCFGLLLIAFAHVVSCSSAQPAVHTRQGSVSEMHDGASTTVLDLSAAGAARVTGAVRSFRASSAHAGVIDVRLVSGGWDETRAFGEVLFDVTRTAALRGSWRNRAKLKAELRVSEPFAGDFARPHRARLSLEDADGRRMYLPNTDIVDRPRGSDGWITLEGVPTTDIPIPLGHTVEGFDMGRIVSIGINVEAGRREGRVTEGTIEIRNVEIELGAEREARVLPSNPAVLAGEATRAANMRRRFEERLGAQHRGVVAGVNLAYPSALAPDGSVLQLYGSWLEAAQPWYGQHYDLRNPAVQSSLRSDFQSIRATFGPRAIVRVALFADLRAGIELEADGTPRAVTPRAVESVRTLLRLAREEHVLVIPVLTDFLLADGRSRAGPDGAWEVGEHPDLITDARKRAALMQLFENFIRELANDPAVLVWEVMNEPENALAVVTLDHFADLQQFLLEGVEAIHRAGELATVGHRNPLDAGRFMRGRVASDLGQAHLYPRFETHPAPFTLAYRAADAFGAIPAGWGESPVRAGRVARDFEEAREGGHAYLLYWSWRSDDPTGDGLFVRAHASEISRALRVSGAH